MFTETLYNISSQAFQKKSVNIDFKHCVFFLPNSERKLAVCDLP